MIKVLDKTFRILESLSLRSPECLTPGRLAKMVGVNASTCSRILKDLYDEGYVEKVSRGEGYRIGPRALAFSFQSLRSNELIRVADPIARDCARRLHASVLIASRQETRRFIVSHHDYHPGETVRINQLAHEDLSDTATGMVLLAHAPLACQKKILKTPKSEGASAESSRLSVDDGLKILDHVRQEGVFSMEREHEPALTLAAPIFQKNQCVAALGATFLRETPMVGDETQLMMDIKTTAEKISKDLDSQLSIG